MLQELTAKEKGDWTPLMAAAESGSVECFNEVLRAIGERVSEEMVSPVLKKTRNCIYYGTATHIEYIHTGLRTLLRLSICTQLPARPPGIQS